jgi:hypothetical protein
MKAIVKDKRDPLFGSIVEIVNSSIIKDHVTVRIIISTSDRWNVGDMELFRLANLKEFKS